MVEGWSTRAARKDPLPPTHTQHSGAECFVDSANYYLRVRVTTLGPLIVILAFIMFDRLSAGNKLPSWAEVKRARLKHAPRFLTDTASGASKQAHATLRASAALLASIPQASASACVAVREAGVYGFPKLARSAVLHGSKPLRVWLKSLDRDRRQETNWIVKR